MYKDIGLSDIEYKTKNMNKFSALNRSGILQKIKTDTYDLLIIGGGITGAGIALDAASRGLKTVLIEKGDFASGTSSKSTKLIHGGLRYLKQFEIALVREVGSERAIVHKLAPHLVTSEKMLLPIIEDGTFGKILTSIGLMVYDVLAGVEKEEQRVMLDKEETIEIEPLLPEKILKGAGLYAEYRTDDARLTIEVLKTAINYDTDAINYVEATEFIYKNDQVVGIQAFDNLAKEPFQIKAKYVVSAAGPWVDELRDINHSKKGSRLHLTKGVHIVVPRSKLPIKHSIYFDVSDGRMIFAIPRGKNTYVGTTDTTYNGDKNHVITNSEDALYLLNAVNNMFPDINLTINDVTSSWAGLRPLIHEEGKSESELSRKDEIFESKTGLISIAGGKLTGYRKMAERLVDLVEKKYEKHTEKKLKECFTDEIPLSGGIFKDAADVRNYVNEIEKTLVPHGFDRFDAKYLVFNYGRQTEGILGKFDILNDADPEIRLAKAELWFTINHEMVISPLDFFVRRTGRLYFRITSIPKIKVAILEEFQSIFNWSETASLKAKKELEMVIYDASYFTDSTV